jgi:SAM-dependent methyltransferase
MASLRRVRDRVLGHPRVYLAVQRIFGSDRLRRLCVDCLEPREGERILDVGCGVGYVLDYMPRVAYYGFDTNSRYIEYARRRFAGRGSFYCEDLAPRHLTALPPIDGALLLGLLHHVPDDVAETIVDLVCRALAPNGRMVTLDPCFEKHGSAVARYVASSDRGAYVRHQPGYLALVSRRFTTTDAVLWRNTGRIPSTEIIMRCSGPIRSAAQP